MHFREISELPTTTSHGHWSYLSEKFFTRICQWVANILSSGKIGMTGFEPTTSCSQGKRSNQTELHPNALVSGLAPVLAVRLSTPYLGQRAVFASTSRVPCYLLPDTSILYTRLARQQFQRRTAANTLYFTKRTLVAAFPERQYCHPKERRIEKIRKCMKKSFGRS